MQPIFAAAAPAFLGEVVALIVCGALIAYVGYRLGLVPIVGFLLTGVVIGPNGLGLVSNLELVDATAEVGVILLLFTIGIEFSLDKLARIKRLIFGGGGLQVVLSTGVTAGILLLFGVPWQAGVFTGFLVALSSTAIVLKLLANRNETGTEAGQLGLGVLIFQDLAIIVMVLMVPILAGEGGSPLDIALALGKATAMIVIVLFGARKAMPALLERVARTCSQELFLLTLIALCFGTAFLSSLAGVSVALGAFLAGLIVSESRFAEHAFGEIMPLQILFSATFFVSVGMLLDLGFLVGNLPLVLGIVALVLAIKVVTTGVSVRALGYGLPSAAAVGLMLAQVGEFSFVLERAGREFGLFPAGSEGVGSQAFIASTVILMILTPPLSLLGTRLAQRLEDMKPDEEVPEPSEMELVEEMEEEAEAAVGEPVHLRNHVIVAGYSVASRRFVRMLVEAGVPHVVVTLSPPRAREAEEAGSPVVRGDATRQHALEHAGVLRAKMLVLPADNPEFAHRVTLVARTVNPTLRIVAHTAFASAADTLAHAGADIVYTDEYEGVVQLFAEVLRDYHVDASDVERCLQVVRVDQYQSFRSESPEGALASIGSRILSEQDSRTVRVREGARAVGRTLGEVDFSQVEVRVAAVRRGRTTVTRPPGSFTLQAGDELQLEGSPEAFAACASWFSTDLLAHPEGDGGAVEEDSGEPATVAVYGTDWCPLTGGFRAYLRRFDVPFIYHNIEQDAAAEAEVLAMNDGKLKFPMVVVGSTPMKNPSIDDLNAALARVGLLEEPVSGS